MAAAARWQSADWGGVMTANVAADASPGRSYVAIGERLPQIRGANSASAPPRFKPSRLPRVALRRPALAPSDRMRDTVDVSTILCESFGVTRQRWIFSEALAGSDGCPRLELLRPVPSGGALFPVEVYLLTTGESALAAGLYHYDAAHHAVEIIREGDLSATLDRTLSCPAASAGDIAILLACDLEKNLSRYGEFGYRLHSLDLGVVLAQCVTVAGMWGLHGSVHYKFLDLAIDALLGLDPWRESVYVVVTFRSDARKMRPRPPTRRATPAATTIAPINGREPIAQWPLLAALHAASLIRSPGSFHVPTAVESKPVDDASPRTALEIPREQLDVLVGVRERRSAVGAMRRLALQGSALAHLLLAASRGYASDVNRPAPYLAHTEIYAVVLRVESVEPGAYRYDPRMHALVQVHRGDLRADLQRVLAWPSHNMADVSACFFPVGEYEPGFARHGDRWYRVQNIEAGMIIQRLSVTAAALGLACDVTLSYHVARANALLALPSGSTALAQVIVGGLRASGQLYEQAIAR